MRKRINELAAKHGLTIAEVERRCGIKPGTIRRWDKHKPLAENLAAVARVLETTVEYLLGERETA